MKPTGSPNNCNFYLYKNKYLSCAETEKVYIIFNNKLFIC